jgi:hypothetical protein
MASRIQVYERLEPLVGGDVAEELAQMVERTADLVTKDLFQSEMRELRHDIDLRFKDVQVQIAELRADTRDWLLRFFVPLWIGVYGTIAAVVISIIVKQ